MIDTHVHLNYCESPVDDIISTAKAAGITHMIQVGTDLKSSQFGVALADKYNCMSATAGIHPLYESAFDQYDEWEEWVKANHNHIVAIGETGLDYKREDVDKKKQKRYFERQLQLAETLGLPVVIHNRQADEDMIPIMNTCPNITLIWHCFTSSMKALESITHPNFLISFTGIITYQKKGKLINVVREWPMDRIMIETDCPYLTPQKYKGVPNEPAYVGEIAHKIAEVKGISYDTVINDTTKTTKRIFNI